MMGYGCIRRLGEEVLAEQPIPVASSGQTCAQPEATVTPANKVLGSARNESKMDMGDAVTDMTENSWPLIRSGTGARLPCC